MNLVDQIEMLGSAVASGLMGEGEAVQLLVEFSDGGLTKTGASSALARHRTIRAEYGRIFDSASAALRALGGA
jgi:hypothetical protein